MKRIKYKILKHKCTECGESPAHYSKLAYFMVCQHCLGKKLFKLLRNGTIGIMAVGSIVLMFL